MEKKQQEVYLKGSVLVREHGELRKELAKLVAEPEVQGGRGRRCRCSDGQAGDH